MALAISIAIFVAMLALVGGLGWALWGRGPVAETESGPATIETETTYISTRELGLPGWAATLADLGEAVPLGNDDPARLRKELAAAGFRGNIAPPIYHGAKAVCMVAAPVLLFLALWLFTGRVSSAWAPAALAVYLGYTSPERYLRSRIRRRRETINRSLPDFLDLLVIGVESGSSLDHAIMDTGRDLRRAHPVLSDELSAFSLEMRAGSSRSEALRNLGGRCGEAELRKLTSLLIQADRFGSSVSRVLRTQARYMRTRRRQRAEEMAHKVGVKLIFPIFFLIMPTVFLVTAGPAVLMLLTNFGALVGGV